MQFTNAFVLVSMILGCTIAAPTPSTSVKRSDDADDAVAYAWAVTGKTKRDAISLPADNVKRSDDADDAVAYAWAVTGGKS